MKTITTISTPIAVGAIGIVRMSGDNALEIGGKMFKTSKLATFCDATPNMMYFGEISANETRDKGYAVYFKAPQSYTGEDVVEFQCHGGIRLVQEVLRACISYGATVADKGEFTRRAFLNGKLALSDAEGIVDMINADSLAALNAGYQLLDGGISAKVAAMQEKLLDGISNLEVGLDYPEEMEEETRADSQVVVENLFTELSAFRTTAEVGKVIKQGIAVAIVGQANVGKSSLLNALLGRERAIVTDIEGTTRDSVEDSIEVSGIMLRLIDTAGIRETADKIEAMGIERSLMAAKASDIVLFLTAANRPFNKEEKALFEQIKESGAQKVLIVCNKSDLGVISEHSSELVVSCKSGNGIADLKQKIVQMFHVEHLSENVGIITNERHKDAITRALECIESVRNVGIATAPVECILVDLRTAYFALGEITGSSASENIIDSIFSKFCLGK